MKIDAQKGEIMQLKKMATASLRLVLAPLKGALTGVQEAAKQPLATSWRQFVLNDMRLYFSPVTGAFAGVREELKRQRSH
jgi:hypothetical protein